MIPKPNDTPPTTASFALGIAFGLTLGFFVGIAIDSFALGFPIGISLGVAAVWLYDRLRFRRQDGKGSE